jgi:hypothetical protein
VSQSRVISSARKSELLVNRSSTIEEELLSLLIQTERITSPTSQTRGTISSYETTVSTSNETECLRDISRKTASMSLKKPSVTAPTGAVGVRSSLTTLHNAFSQPEDWTLALKMALESTTLKPKNTDPAPNTSLAEHYSENTATEKQTLFVNNGLLAGCSVTSALNTPNMNTPLMNTPQQECDESPLTKMLNNEKLQVTEIMVPVVEDPHPTTIPAEHNVFPVDEFTAVWDATTFNDGPFALDPFQCLNPRLAEGLPEQSNEDIDEGIDEPDMDTSPMFAGEYFNNIADAFIPTTVEMTKTDAMTVDEGSLCNTEAMVDLGEGDLLQWLVDETISPDAAFPYQLEATMVKEKQHHIPATVTSQQVEEPVPSPSASTIIKQQVSKDDQKQVKIEILKPKKKGRGRPPRIEARVITPKPTRDGRVTKVNDHVYVMREDSEDQKYRRMRDLNNEASKRCRQNRKTKLVAVEIEMEYLENKNKELRFKVRKMEEIVSTLKKKFISDIANPKQKAKREILAADIFPVQQDMGLVQATNTSQQVFVVPTPSQQVFVVPTPPQAFKAEQTNFPDLLDMEWGSII